MSRVQPWALGRGAWRPVHAATALGTEPKVGIAQAHCTAPRDLTYKILSKAPTAMRVPRRCSFQQCCADLMRAERPPLTRLLLKGILVLALCCGALACGGESDRSDRSVAAGSGGAGASSSGTENAVEPDVGTAGPTQGDTAVAEETAPRPIDVGDSVKFEDVEANATPPEEEASGTTPDTEPTDPAPDPPEPEPERSRLEFSTDPGEATVVIENQETGTRRSKETPATFEVPPGLYSWSVKKEGYTSKESRRAINLETQREYTQRIDLVSVSGDGAYLVRADRAYQQNKYRQAISLYQQVPEPSAEQDPTDFLRAQGRLGRIHWKQEGNYEAAIQAYRNVIEYDEARYGAYLNLAQIHFETENYGEVLGNLDRVSQLKYSIPAQNQKRLRISLRARYLRGRALFQQAKDERTRNRRSKALRANQEFQGFLSSVPPDLQSTFSRQIREAQQKKEEVRTLLREELR